MIQNCCALAEYKNITFHAPYDKFEERMWKIRNKRLWLKPHYQINGRILKVFMRVGWVIPTNSLYLASSFKARLHSA